MYSQQMRLLVDKLLQKDCDVRPSLQELFSLFPAANLGPISLRGPKPGTNLNNEARSKEGQGLRNGEDDEYSGDLEADGGEGQAMKEMPRKSEAIPLEQPNPEKKTANAAQQLSIDLKKQETNSVRFEGGTQSTATQLVQKSADMLTSASTLPHSSQAVTRAANIPIASNPPQTPGKSKPGTDFKIRNSTGVGAVVENREREMKFTDTDQRTEALDPKKSPLQSVAVLRGTRGLSGAVKWRAGQVQEPLANRVWNGPPLGSPHDTGRANSIKIVSGTLENLEQQQPQVPSMQIERAKTAGVIKTRPITSSANNEVKPRSTFGLLDPDLKDQGQASGRPISSLNGYLTRGIHSRPHALAKDPVSYKLGSLIESGRPKTGNVLNTGLNYQSDERRLQQGNILGLGNIEKLPPGDPFWLDPLSLPTHASNGNTVRLGTSDPNFQRFQFNNDNSGSKQAEQRRLKGQTTGRGVGGITGVTIKALSRPELGELGYIPRVQTAHYTNRGYQGVVEGQSRPQSLMTQNFLSKQGNSASSPESNMLVPKGAEGPGQKATGGSGLAQEVRGLGLQMAQGNPEFLKNLASKRPTSSQTFKRLTIHDL